MKTLSETIATLERHVAEVQATLRTLKTNDFVCGDFVLLSQLGSGYVEDDEVKGQFGFKGPDDMAFYAISDNGFHRVDAVVISMAESDQQALKELFDRNYADGYDISSPTSTHVVVNNRGPYGVQYAYKVVRKDNHEVLDDYTYYLERLPHKNFVVPVEYRAAYQC